MNNTCFGHAIAHHQDASLYIQCIQRTIRVMLSSWLSGGHQTANYKYKA
jgi:hypothetical protein